MTQVILTAVGAGTWTVPDDWNSENNTIELIGGGQSGWIATNNNGGAGADYARISNLALTPGDVINRQIGGGGAATTNTTPNAGGDTWFGSVSTALAKGGGSATASIGDVVHAGGAVALSGGGGAGGPNGPGNSSGGTTGGSGDAGLGGTGGTLAADGGAGTEWGTAGSGGGGGASATSNGGNGGAYGAGGGGARSGHTAGAGAQGVIVITYTPPVTQSFAADQQLADAAVSATAQQVDQAQANQTLDSATVASALKISQSQAIARVMALPRGDITTFWDITNLRGDWQVSGGALASGDDLTTAVLISLFTDRRANADDVLPDASTDRRGWWGDLDQDVPIGSRLWLLSRSKLIPAVARSAKGYIGEALQWLLDDGVAASINISTSIVMPSRLYATVDILRTDGSRQSLNFNWAWNQLN